MKKFKEYSPEFFWLIRDVTLEITDENDKTIDIKTYMEKKVIRHIYLTDTIIRKKNWYIGLVYIEHIRWLETLKTAPCRNNKAVLFLNSVSYKLK